MGKRLNTHLSTEDMLALDLQRSEQCLAAGVVPAFTTPTYRGCDAVVLQHPPQALTRIPAAPISVEHQRADLARVALEPGHSQGIDDDVACHVFTQAPAHHLAAVQADDHGE